MSQKERWQYGDKETLSEREALVRRILVTKEPCKEGAYQVKTSIDFLLHTSLYQLVEIGYILPYLPYFGTFGLQYDKKHRVLLTQALG